MGVVKGVAYLLHPQPHYFEYLGKSLIMSIPIVPRVNRQYSLQMRSGRGSLAFGLGIILPVLRSLETILLSPSLKGSPGHCYALSDTTIEEIAMQ